MRIPSILENHLNPGIVSHVFSAYEGRVDFFLGGIVGAGQGRRRLGTPHHMTWRQFFENLRTPFYPY